MAAGRHLGFGLPRSSAIENPTLEPDTIWIRRSVAQIWPLEIFQSESSFVGGSVLNIHMYTDAYTTLHYVTNIARKE